MLPVTLRLAHPSVRMLSVRLGLFGAAGSLCVTCPTLSSSPQGHLYLLVTDQGFLQEEQVVWESLHNVDGDSCFCDSEFHLSHSLGKGPGAEGGSDSPEKQRQVDQVRGAFGKGARSTFASELFAIGELHAFCHLEILTRDTHVPLPCYLWTIPALGVCSLPPQITYLAVSWAVEEEKLERLKGEGKLVWKLNLA